VGANTIVQKLHQGLGTNRSRIDLLAKLSDSQVQAKGYKDHSISHQDEATKTTAAVSLLAYGVFNPQTHRILLIQAKVNWYKKEVGQERTPKRGKGSRGGPHRTFYPKRID
jgi:hypothetical protein